MTTRLRLDDVRRALEARDPALVELVAALAAQPDTSDTPVREGAPTFAKFVAEIRSKPFRRKPRDEQAHYRQSQVRALEAPDAEAPLPDRLRLHEVLDALWRDDSPFARSCLLALIARVPLRYGPWRALKRIFKEAEARGDTEVFGALAARFDSATGYPHAEVATATLAYLRRRAWRYLRRIAIEQPASYADVAADMLAHYQQDTTWHQTWVANHIFYHETGKYDKSTFKLYSQPPDLLKDRAFADLWRRTPRPLFSLLERARCDRVRQFAADALKADFRASLRDVEPAWVARLVGVQSRAIDDFVVWVLNNVPRFEQGSFRALGLHDAALRLFESPSNDARAYASEYARTHARDLSVDALIALANNAHVAVRRLASDLLLAREPRQEVGLDAWGRLLESSLGLELAGGVLRKHFGASELTPDWFRARFFSGSPSALQFAREALPQIHPYAKLGPGYFLKLIETGDEVDTALTSVVVFYAQSELPRFDLNALDADPLRRLLLRPDTRATTTAWIESGRLNPQALGLDYLKTVAFHPDWEADPALSALRRDGPPWARALAFDEGLSETVLGWLRDVRRFAPADLGFDWLLKLAARGEPRYHNAAVEIMIKGFVPADFAPRESVIASKMPSVPVAVDFQGASFLFTGKMATMKRKDAEDNVRKANGATASGVSAKLHYLVIGDEGSSLYGHGKKGDKQLKAEEVNAAGGNIKIISETAFLKMLAGAAQEVSADATLAGCDRLWAMATAPGAADAPLAQFAIKYLRRHHPDINLAETDRPVDPGAEVPASFLDFARVRPLFDESRKPLRDLALELARWEFARWSPPAEELVALAGSSHADVRKFVAEALLAEDTPENRRFRIDPDAMTPAAVYTFCESADEATRALGMRLIERSPRLRVPEELFRLTESPDRRVRAFVIRALWSLYRDRGISEDWKPRVPPAPTVGAAARKAAAQDDRGPGPPARPETLPSSPRGLWEFLRRILFELPPPRPEKRDGMEGGDRLPPLPARRAKLGLIEVMRDLALEELDFARGALPLFEEFMNSRGKSERDACLVAVTRLRHVHPALHLDREGAAS